VLRETEAYSWKILHAEEISTVDKNLSVARKRKQEILIHSQVAEADDASRQQSCGRAGNSDCSESSVPVMENAASNSKG